MTVFITHNRVKLALRRAGLIEPSFGEGSFARHREQALAPHFEAAVKEAGVGSVMCSYNRLNGQYACENQHLLEDVLKGEWDFKGFVLTDYGANKSTANALNNGLDLDIWPGIAYRPELVTAAWWALALWPATAAAP